MWKSWSNHHKKLFDESVQQYYKPVFALLCPYFEKFFSKSHAWLPFKDRLVNYFSKLKNIRFFNFWQDQDIEFSDHENHENRTQCASPIFIWNCKWHVIDVQRFSRSLLSRHCHEMTSNHAMVLFLYSYMVVYSLEETKGCVTIKSSHILIYDIARAIAIVKHNLDLWV